MEDGKQATKLRPLKVKARKMGDWALKSKDRDSGGWESRLAVELSIALERLGVATFSGIIPARFLLPLAADQIIDDYQLCKPWIDDYRKDQNAKNKELQDYHRRHAEWLALLSVLWMARHYPSYVGLPAWGSLTEVRTRARRLSLDEVDMLDRSVRRLLWHLGVLSFFDAFLRIR